MNSYSVLLIVLRSGQIEGNSDLVDISGASDDTQEICTNQVQTLPIFLKIEDLSNKVQVNMIDVGGICISTVPFQYFTPIFILLSGY